MPGKAKQIRFIKMQGCGNDQIVIDGMKSKFAESPRLIRKLCNRRFGIGADQMLLLLKSSKADYKMRIFNADGSEAEMCGNGIRCLARYLRDAKYTQKKELKIETLAGMRNVILSSKNIMVNLGEPKMKGKEIPVHLSGRIINRPLKIDTKDFRITCLSLGNPHCIIFVENLEAFPLQKYGPLLENHHVFPRRANISFVNVLTPNKIKVRVWERGSGETLACGTAAAASVVASVLNGYTERKAEVELPGGKLEVEWKKDDNTVWLAGGAETVFEGTFLL